MQVLDSSEKKWFELHSRVCSNEEQSLLLFLRGSRQNKPNNPSDCNKDTKEQAHTSETLL